jgi:hypothetical protein
MVMAGHSRSKNGVASLAYVPAIHVFLPPEGKQDVDARHKAGHDAAISIAPGHIMPRQHFAHFRDKIAFRA